MERDFSALDVSPKSLAADQARYVLSHLPDDLGDRAWIVRTDDDAYALSVRKGVWMTMVQITLPGNIPAERLAAMITRRVEYTVAKQAEAERFTAKHGHEPCLQCRKIAAFLRSTWSDAPALLEDLL